MKTKSLLIAALVSILFVTTSCQKEETILPAGTDQFSTGTTETPSRKEVENDIDTINEEPAIAPKPQTAKDAEIIKIGKVNIDKIN